MGAVADGLGNILAGKPEEGFKQLASGVLAAGSAFATLLSTFERSKFLTGLLGGEALLVPHLLAIVAAIAAIVAIIKICNWAINRETNALKENSEEIHLYLQQFIIYWEYEEFYCIRHFCLSFTHDGLQ